MAGWREWLRAIRDRLFGGKGPPEPKTRPSQASTKGMEAPVSELTPGFKAEPPTARSAVEKTRRSSSRTVGSAPASRPALQSVAINLGIDFGTSFTKICYRDLGMEESGIVAVGRGFKEALIPSIVAIDGKGGLHSGDSVDRLKSPIRVTYLKMRLADAPTGDELPEAFGMNLNQPTCIQALSAWFLASVIARSQNWMARYESDRLKNRRPVWSANLGVPVEHYDSEALGTFMEVLGVAWLWVKDGRIPATLGEAVAFYVSTKERLTSEVTDFHAIPEIAAAVQSFVISREAVPGIYVYFDIGGGTVDGVAFKFTNYDGERRIDFYSGKVEPLGVESIGAFLGGNGSREIDAVELEALLKTCDKAMHDGLVHRVRQLVGVVIMTAKKKDGRDWQQDIHTADYERKFLGRLSPSRMRPLIVFIGGGGSECGWFRTAIESTYESFQHRNAGIPPYKLLEVPKPGDFRMSGLGDEAFIRFAISYGLSIPFGEGPDIRLPGAFDVAPKPPRWTPPGGIVDYGDSKDVSD